MVFPTTSGVGGALVLSGFPHCGHLGWRGFFLNVDIVFPHRGIFFRCGIVFSIIDILGGRMVLRVTEWFSHCG